MKHFLITIIAITSLISCGGAEERKEVYLEKARQSLEAGDLDKARIELKNVLQIDPKHAQAYFFLGDIFDSKNEHKKAYVNYLKAVELDPENLQYHAKIGTYLLILTRDIDTAIEKRDFVLSVDPTNISGLLLKAGILFKQGDKFGAKEITQNIFSANPGHVKNAMFLSSLHQSDKEYEDSINVLNACIKENSNELSLVSALADAYSKAKKYDLAEKEYRKILENKPEIFANYLKLAQFYIQVGNVNEAENIIREAIEADTNDVNRIISLVESIKKNKGNQSAIDELTDFINKYENMGELRLALANIYYSENNIDSAVKVLKNAISDFSEETTGIKSRLLLAGIYMQMKPIEIDAAINIIDEASNISPNDAEVNFYKGKLQYLRDDYDNTIISLRTVVKDDPENIEAYIILSAAHNANGDTAQAEEIMERAYVNNRANTNGLIALARYYDKKKNSIKLEKAIDAFLAIRPDNYEALSYKSSLLNNNKMFSEADSYASKIIELYPNWPNGYLYSAFSLWAKDNKIEAVKLLEEGYLKVGDKRSALLEPLLSLYANLNDFTSAENKIQSAILESGESAELYMLLAKVQFSSKKVDDAKTSLFKAKDINPGLSEPYLTLADIYTIEKQNQKAIDILQQGLMHPINDLKLTLALTSRYEANGDYNAAINEYEKAYEKNSNNFILANNLASLLSEHRDDETSLKRAQELAYRLKDIDKPVILDTAGWVYFKIGNYSEAVNILNAVVEKSPEVPVFNYHLGMALYKAGDEVAAKTYLTNALDNNRHFRGRDEAEALLKSIQ